MIKQCLTLLLMALSFFSFGQVDFLPQETITTGSHAEVVAIGDVNNDGLDDVVLGTGYYFDSANDYKLFVFRQNATGGLDVPFKYPYPDAYPGLKAITIADVNNDGLNDVIIGYGDQIGIFFQDAFGSLYAPQTFFSGTGVEGLDCGDLNNDGLTDIAVSHRTETYIRVFYQTANGFYNDTYLKPTSGWDEIEIGDVSGDGLNDVVLKVGQGQSALHVYTQDTTGQLDPYVTYTSPGGPIHGLSAIALGDLNNDGRNDVLGAIDANTPNGRLVQWFQDPTTGLLQEPPVTISAYDLPDAVEIADLNCDGQNEIVVAHGGWLRSTVYEQDNNGEYNTYSQFNIPYASHYSPHSLAVGDFNADGLKDVAIADYNHGLIVLRNDGELPPNAATVTVLATEATTDTIYTNTFTGTTGFTDTITYDSNGYRVTVIDSFMVTGTFHEDSVQLDSLVVTQTELCEKTTIDSMLFSSVSYYLKGLGTDTTLEWTLRDSIDLTIIPPDTTGQGTDTTGQGPDTTTTVVEIKQIKLYPNPTNGPITVEFPSPYDTKSLVTTMYDARGKVVMQQTYTEDAIIREFDLSPYANGVYLLSFSIRGVNPVNVKVVKAR